MNSTLLWPYTEEEYSILYNKTYRIKGIASPETWGYSDVFDKYNNKKIEIKSDDTLSDNFDILLISESVSKLNFDDYVYPFIERFVEKKIQIHSLYKFDKVYQERIMTLCNNNNIEYKLIDNRIKLENTLKKRLNRIKKPVIFSIGHSENTGKTSTLIEIHNQLSGMGYKIHCICPKGYSEIWGFSGFPLFNMPDISIEEQILAFHEYIKKIERDENPDIFLVGIPGGIMPLNNEMFNGFGLLLFFVSLVITPDFVVYNTLYDNYNKDYLDLLNLITKYRYGFEIDCFVIHKKIVNIYSVLKEKVELFNIDSIELYNNKIDEMEKLSLPFCRVQDVTDRILYKLNKVYNVEVI